MSSSQHVTFLVMFYFINKVNMYAHFSLISLLEIVVIDSQLKVSVKEHSLGRLHWWMCHFGALVVFAFWIVCKFHTIIHSMNACYVLFSSAEKSGVSRDRLWGGVCRSCLREVLSDGEEVAPGSPSGQPSSTCMVLKASHRLPQPLAGTAEDTLALPPDLALARIAGSQSSLIPPWLCLHFTPFFVHSSSWQWLAPSLLYNPLSALVVLGLYWVSDYRPLALPPALTLPCFSSPVLLVSVSLTSQD